MLEVKPVDTDVNLDELYATIKKDISPSGLTCKFWFELVWVGGSGGLVRTRGLLDRVDFAADPATFDLIYTLFGNAAHRLTRI